MASKSIDIISWEIARDKERKFPVEAEPDIRLAANIKHIFLKKLPDKNVCIYLVWETKSEGVIKLVATDCICLVCAGSDISDATIDKLLFASYNKFENAFDEKKKMEHFRYQLCDIMPSVVEDARRQIIKRLPNLK